MKHIIIIYLLCLPLLALAQISDYEIALTSFSTKDGLSNDDVFCINKDGRGVMWVGTRYGLNRFDGQAFRAFTKKDGLKNNFVSAIFRIDERYFLLGFGVSYIRYQHVRSYQIWDTHRKEVIALEKLVRDLPFVEAEVRQVRYLETGFLFILNNGHRYFWGKDKTWKTLDFLKKQEDILAVVPNQYVWALDTTAQDAKLIKRNEKGQILKSITIKTVRKIVSWSHSDSKDNHYFCFDAPDASTILQVTPSGKQKEIARVSRPNDFFLVEMIEYHAATDAYWCASPFYHILVKDGQVVWEIPNDKSGFMEQGRQSYFETEEIWQCGKNGFSRIAITQKRFKTILANQPERYSTRGIIKVGDKILINSNEKVYQSQGNSAGLFIDTIGLASVRINDNSFWLGGQKQLQRVNATTKSIETFKTERNEIWSLWQAPDGILWFSETGLNYLNPKTKEVKAAAQGFEDITKGAVYQFYPISKSKVWLCSATGLYELDLRSRKITARYWSGGKGKYYLPTDELRHLYHDKKNGEFWIATGQDGLLRWKPATNETELFSFNSLSTNTMHGIYADEYGFLWLLTDDGIVQWQRKTGHFRVYRTQDGLPTNEFNRISHFQNTDGTLYFGSVNGVTVFHPRDFVANFERTALQSPIVVEVQQYNGRKNQVEDNTFHFLTHGSLTLNPSDRFFTLTLAVADYNAPKETVYLYQIKGDATWQKAESNQLTFWRLPYGRQTILIKAELPDGNFSEVCEVKVLAKPPFYMRWWFVLLLLLLIGVIFYWRFKELQNQNIRLEQEVVSRTEKIERQAAELMQLDEMKSRFFANISHELRTPLTLIASPLQLLMREETDPEKRQSLYFAAKNSQRLLRLVNEILDLTKLKATKLDLEPQNVQLLHFARQLLAEFESLATHKGISLLLETTLHEATTAFFDLKKVETILYNLISNALKFTPQGGKVILSIKKEQEKEALNFKVTDTGRGIATEDLPYIFDRFYQSKIQKAAEGGTGIGLAICREFATLMNGALAAQSEMGKGTVFTFVLPLTQPLFLADTAQTLPQNLRVTTQTKKSLPNIAKNDMPHLLLVEDNEDLQGYITALLKDQYRVTVANNGKMALDTLQAFTPEQYPALILSDVMMPEMDGFELLQRLKNSPEYRQIPVIMLTARASLDDRLKALRIGVDDYLTKPFLADELHARIKNLVHRADMRNAFKAMTLETEIPATPKYVATEVATKTEETEKTENYYEWLAEVEKYILRHISDGSFSLEMVATAFEMSRFKFTRKLNLAVGMSASDYILEIRLNEARRRLNEQPDLQVKELAASVGFSNSKLFSRKFYDRFGVYPSKL